jgi:photosystem II stability/assembly factor-like uncharacterized protein
MDFEKFRTNILGPKKQLLRSNDGRRSAWGSSILKKYLKGSVTSIFALETQILH